MAAWSAWLRGQRLRRLLRHDGEALRSDFAGRAARARVANFGLVGRQDGQAGTWAQGRWSAEQVDIQLPTEL